MRTWPAITYLSLLLRKFVPAGARTHRDAPSRCEAHGGVNRNTVAQSAEACSVTKVGEDGSPGKPCAEVMHERLVRKTMETIAPNTCVEISLRKR